VEASSSVNSHPHPRAHCLRARVSIPAELFFRLRRFRRRCEAGYGLVVTEEQLLEHFCDRALQALEETAGDDGTQRYSEITLQ
jgi:hypothetical protein